ncbi:branched-chain amino acid ABC transporter permease [Micromonospora sp. STR1s_5]|nr:branched-chain amino acid ABC transporter permease [Micromonospora sp. STR1s_5]
MSIQLLLAQILTGIATGALYFLVASGLTLVWGALGVVNLAHGSFFMIAAFAATSIIAVLGPNLGFLAALVCIPLAALVLSGLLEVTFFRHVYRGGIWGQLLLTFGLVLVLNDLTRSAFGSLPRSAMSPDILRGYIEIAGIRTAKYQLAVILITGIVSACLWYLLARSRTGRLIRAAVDDPAMLGAVGVDVTRLRTHVMAVSALLAAVAGVVAAPRGAVNATLGCPDGRHCIRRDRDRRPGLRLGCAGGRHHRRHRGVGLDDVRRPGQRGRHLRPDGARLGAAADRPAHDHPALGADRWNDLRHLESPACSCSAALPRSWS